MTVVMLLGPIAAAQTLFPLQSHPEGTEWPTDEWRLGAMPGDISPMVDDLIETAFATDKTELMGETRGLVIVHRGRLVAERYAPGFKPDTKQVSWSMAKSVTSALVGRAVHLGLVKDIDAPMPAQFDVGDPRAEITWRQWLNMTDGLDYTEIGEPDLAKNDVVQMMFGAGRFDALDYVKDEAPAKHEPGEVWNYSTAGYHTISGALQIELMGRLGIDRNSPESEEKGVRNSEIVSRLNDGARDSAGMIGFVDFLEAPFGPRPNMESWSDEEWQKVGRKGFFAQFIAAGLMHPLGIDAQPEFDPSGTYYGGSYIWSSPRDFAKFGYLYLRDGVWDGTRLLPEGWVDFSRSKTPADNSNVYGAGWWITAYGEERTHTQNAATPPWDAFHAGGNEGQTIWVVPSRDLVIVRLGLMSNEPKNWEALYEWNQSVARAFPEVTP